MIATLPIAQNRIASHFPTPEPELPQSARERGRLWSDTVFQAVLALKAQLRNPDAHIVMAAANAILEMERTRMRHAKSLAGSEHVSEAQEEYEAEEQRAEESQRARRDRVVAATADEKVARVAEVAPTLADHARAARRAFHLMDCAMTEAESLEFTVGFLKHLGRNAGDVSTAEFAAILRTMRESDERDRATAPLRAG